jgi:hypothetical protein
MKLPDNPILEFIRKARSGKALMGRKLTSAQAQGTGAERRFIGPSEWNTKMYYLFHIRSHRNQNVELKVNTFTRWDHSTVEVLLDYVPVPNTGVIPLKRGEHFIIVKQNHKKSDTAGRSWITMSVRGERGLEQRLPTTISPPEKPARTRRRATPRGLLPGLVGEYFKGTNLEQPLVSRIDETIGLGWATSEGSPVPHDTFSVRWSGWIVAPVAGPYKLMLDSDDGHRLWLDGRRLANAWAVGRSKRSEVAVTLDTEPHALVIEYFENGGGQRILFQWQTPGVSQLQDVPASALFHSKGPLDRK